MSILDGIAQMVSGSSPDMDQLVRERQRERWFRLLQRSTASAAASPRVTHVAPEPYMGIAIIDSLSPTSHSPPDIDPLGR